mgnify:CR=1 FL=1
MSSVMREAATGAITFDRQDITVQDADLLRSIAAARPVVMVLEDLQWAPTITLAFLDAIVTAAALFNGARILHDLYPAFPEVKTYLQLGTGLVDPPWRWIRPLNLHLILDVWGLSYLMPGDVLLTSWATYFAMKTVKLVGLQAGYRKPRFPFYQEVSSGACIALVLFIGYVSRRHLRRVLRSIIRGPGEYDRNEAMSYRALLVVFVLALAIMLSLIHISEPTRPY